MRFTVTIAAALLTASSVVFHPSPAEGGNACTAELEGWQIIPDTASVVPNFVFESRLDVDRIVACDDGVYIFFKSREWGRVVHFCLIYPKPTQVQYAKYFGTEEMDIQKRTQELLAAVAQATAQYDRFRTELEEVLGKKYRENSVMSFENARFYPVMSMKMGSPIRLDYRKRSTEFSPMMDVYFKPAQHVPTWAYFVLLYAAFAYR